MLGQKSNAVPLSWEPVIGYTWGVRNGKGEFVKGEGVEGWGVLGEKREQEIAVISHLECI